MQNRIRNQVICLMALAILALAGPNALRNARAEIDVPPVSVIRLTPPAPIFDQTKRLEELASRRKRVAEAIGPRAILVLFSAEPRVYTNDVDYPFRQENILY